MPWLDLTDSTNHASTNGTWSYTPDQDFNGTVNFTYSVSDGSLAAAGSASLEVSPVNDAPTTTAVILPGMAEDSDTVTLTTAQLLAGAKDVDLDTR